MKLLMDIQSIYVGRCFLFWEELIVVTDEQKIGTCEMCGATNVVVTASGFYVAFVCDECLEE